MTCPRSHWSRRGWGTSASWDSSKPRCCRRHGSIRGRVPAGLAIGWSWDSGSRRAPSVDSDWSPPLCSPSSVERPPDVVEGPTWSRLCWQISIASFVVFEKLSLSILASSQKWATATPKKPCKNYRKGCHSASKSPLHTTKIVQVCELRLGESQRHQDLLQRLFLGTRLHSLRRFASDIHSFTQAAVQLWLQSCRFSWFALLGGHILGLW